MRSVQTSRSFSLSAVKPLDDLLQYREFCLRSARKACEGSLNSFDRSPVSGAPLESFKNIGGFNYSACPDNGGIFLRERPEAAQWRGLLEEIASHRRSDEAFHSKIERSRQENVYRPKLEWIQNTLKLQGFHQPKALIAATAPDDFVPLAQNSRLFSLLSEVDETRWLLEESLASGGEGTYHAALLFESLDRSLDPVKLLDATRRSLREGGLVFLTGLVYSGFDMSVLGADNLYLYPPDRANCFTLEGLERMLQRAGFTLIEVSTPGVLDVDIVLAHLAHTDAPLSAFEKRLLESSPETRASFQTFLQQSGMSSFARIVGKKKNV